jgi:hypothetical protein
MSFEKEPSASKGTLGFSAKATIASLGKVMCLVASG